MADLNIGIAFAAGFASFISPCCLPLYPSYLSYITGISVTQIKSDTSRHVRWKTMSHTLFFILGFSMVFYALGYGANAFAELFREYQDLIRQVSAILIMLMGLFLMGIFQPQLLMKERKFDVSSRPEGYLGSFIFGVGFSAGWSPCIGPILSSIILLAASNPGTWAGLTTAYSLGFAVPFFYIGVLHRFHALDFEIFANDDENRRRAHVVYGNFVAHRQDDRHHVLAAGFDAGMAEVLAGVQPYFLREFNRFFGQLGQLDLLVPL